MTTRPEDVLPERLRRARSFRRVGIGVLAAVILAGLLNQLGVRMETVATERNGYHLSVRYARVTRPGLATPWTVQVRRAGGFDGPVTISTDAAYFERFDFNQFYPEPSTTSSRGSTVLLTFEGIEGDLLTVRFDGRATPTFILDLARGSTGLEVGGTEIARVDYTTVVMP